MTNINVEKMIEEYKTALKKRKETIDYNQKIKKKVRITHTLFALFFLCIGYAYLKPQYVKGIYGEALEAHIQAEYSHLVSTGWNDIGEIHSYLQQYRENKENSYIVLGNTVYRTREIPNLLLRSNIGFLVKPVFDAAAFIRVFVNRGYASISSIFLLLKDSGNGVIRIQQLGDVVASGIWVYFLHLFYWAVLWFYTKCSNTICNREYTDYAVEPYYSFPILVRDEYNSHIVMFYDMVEIINHPLERIEPPVIYAWIYGRLGIQ